MINFVFKGVLINRTPFFAKNSSAAPFIEYNFIIRGGDEYALSNIQGILPKTAKTIRAR